MGLRWWGWRGEVMCGGAAVAVVWWWGGGCGGDDNDAMVMMMMVVASAHAGAVGFSSTPPTGVFGGIMAARVFVGCGFTTVGVRLLWDSHHPKRVRPVLG
ncbi:hypothetical protein Tco_0194894 [Tanacetum coccineum]